MKGYETSRGFRRIDHENYPPTGKEIRLVQESSAVGDYEDSYEKPGSSYLWIGEDHHLDRAEVAQFVVVLQTWLETGRLPEPEKGGR